MLTLELESEIACPIDEVFAFLADWGALPTWQPEFLEVEQTTLDSVAVGTTFRYVRRVPFGRQRGTMEVTEFSPPRPMAAARTEGRSSPNSAGS